MVITSFFLSLFLFVILVVCFQNLTFAFVLSIQNFSFVIVYLHSLWCTISLFFFHFFSLVSFLLFWLYYKNNSKKLIHVLTSTLRHPQVLVDDAKQSQCHCNHVSGNDRLTAFVLSCVVHEVFVKKIYRMLRLIWNHLLRQLIWNWIIDGNISKRLFIDYYCPQVY